ncbi:MAG: zincin-like metallopeptidase domain-containing protein [Bdellovibrionales bacterium]|nr:zincin-like metallopeptidase domain-containing protein [Bdellovibrionales bacterium]
MVKKDIYQEITNQIISDLEKGLPVWEKPWEKGFMGFPVNVFSKSFYSGVNTLILWLRQSQIGFETSQWITFLQVKKLGGKVKKREKATPIVFYKKLLITDEKTEEEKTIPILKTHAVFNLSQTKGLEHLIKKSSSKEDPHFQDVEKAEELIKKSKADISFAPIDRACYLPIDDKILMPKKEQFKTGERFYSTMFHELSHWTGHKSRLDRAMGGKKGSKTYAFEELVAEISASFICCHLGFEYSTQHSAYVKDWLEVLKEDKKAIFKASSKAQKATEFILRNVQDEAS